MSDEYIWHETDIDISDHAYENAMGDIIYIADTYTEGLAEPVQVELEDFNNERYEVRNKRHFAPEEAEDGVIYESMDLEEAKAVLDVKAETQISIY